MFPNNLIFAPCSALTQNFKNPLNKNFPGSPQLYDFPFLSYKRLKKIYFSPFQVVQVHAISKQLGPVCAAKPGLVSLVLRSKIKKIYFALERRCKNRRHLQVVPKHGSMGQNILVHLHRHGFSNVFYSTMLKQLRS